jgi:tetratricopeptide (TPR) repeat protein
MRAFRPSSPLRRSAARWAPFLAFAAFVALAAWLAASGRLREALPGATPSPTLSNATDPFVRGNEDYDRGDYTGAIAEYTRAIEADPANAQAYNNRAYTYMRLEDYAPALADLDEALRLRPDYVNALINRGDIHTFYYDVDYARAIDDYNRALALDPGNETACTHRAVALSQGNDLMPLWRGLTGQQRVGCPAPTAAP